MLLDGERVNKVATTLGTSQNTGIEWRNRFTAKGAKGLHDLPRSGKPPKYDKEFRGRVLKILELMPPKGQARWDGASLAKHLGASDDAVWRVLRNEAWLAAHPNVRFHFTPTSASRLNQVEIWFGILSRKALKNAGFKSVERLRSAIEAFIEAYQSNAKPFVWRKREVRGSQLRNTIMNLCN